MEVLQLQHNPACSQIILIIQTVCICYPWVKYEYVDKEIK